MIIWVVIMKIQKERLLLVLKLSLLMGTAFFCVIRTDEVKAEVSSAAQRCIYVLIPSLYAMLAVTSLITASGITGRLPKPAAVVGKALFGMTPQETSAFVLGMFAGYPVGTRMLVSGESGKRRAELLSGVCFGAGPSFISGCVSGELYGSRTVGRIIILSGTGANLLLAFVLSFMLRDGLPDNNSRQPVRLTGIMLSEAVKNSGKALGMLCLAVMAFSVPATALECTDFASDIGSFVSQLTDIPSEDAEVMLRSVLDITSLGELSHGNYRLLPWICALVSFGGICVMFQISAVTSGKISLIPLVVTRLAAAVVSFFMCRILMTFMLRDEVIRTSATEIHSFRSDSPIPSLLLIVMTVMVISASHRGISGGDTNVRKNYR